MQTRDIQNFAQEVGDERFIVYPSQSTRPPPPLLNAQQLSQDVIDEHNRGTQPSDVFVYGLEGYTCWGTGLLVRGRQVFLANDVMPPYFATELANLPDVWAGALRHPAPRVVSHNGPLAVALHPNIVYGHFLLEMLPRLYLLGVTRSLGFDFPLLVQHSLPSWVRDFISLYFPNDRLVTYNWSNEAVTALKFIVPSMMHTHFAYHPAFNLMVDDVLRRSGVALLGQSSRQERHIYLSRTQHQTGWHLIENEADVEAMMSDLGFEIIHPQTLSITQQLQIYSSSSIIVGQYSSALHNALFAPFGATVIALNRVNWYQDAVARLRQHRLAYVLPSDGHFRDYRLRSSEVVRFQINLDDLSYLIANVL